MVHSRAVCSCTSCDCMLCHQLLRFPPPCLADMKHEKEQANKVKGRLDDMDKEVRPSLVANDLPPFPLLVFPALPRLFSFILLIFPSSLSPRSGFEWHVRQISREKLWRISVMRCRRKCRPLPLRKCSSCCPTFAFFSAVRTETRRFRRLTSVKRCVSLGTALH